MNPKLVKFTNVIIVINILFNLTAAAYAWYADGISMNTSPLFQTALLFVIAGMLFNIFIKQKTETEN